MKAFLKWLLLVPAAAIALAFAVANRHWIEVSFDPTGLVAPGFSIRAPLFVVLVLAVMSGVVIGSAATWLSQGRYRKAARSARAQVEDLKSTQAQAPEEAGRLRAQIAALPPPLPTVGSREAA